MNTRLPNKVWRMLLFSTAVVSALVLAFNLPTLPAAGGLEQGRSPWDQAFNPNATGTATATQAPEKEIYLPLVQSKPNFVDLAFVADVKGERATRFYYSDPLHYTVQGTNNTGQPVRVTISWSQTGPCAAGAVNSTALTVAPGPWRSTYSTIAPNCAGPFVSTVQVSYLTEVKNLTTRFSVNDPVLTTYSDKPAFDKCNIPTLTQLQTWWNDSPYYTLNLYFGGISRYCSNAGLTEAWVTGAAAQGWSFIPTWVGPQAPCSSWRHKMTRRLADAYQQGKDEAFQAADAARNLGLLDNSPIYYDLESYSDSDPVMSLTTCRSIVKEFMRGWTDGLHARFYKSGVYGTPCTSYLTDFAAIDPAPDVVWIAWWTESYYTPGVSVYGIICGLADNYWADRQRLRQYTGGHREVWGGVSLTIDSNSADGEVSVLPRPSITPTAVPTHTPTPTATATGGPPSGTGLQAEAAPAEISLSAEPGRNFGLVSELEGWFVSGGRLLWTRDGGEQWSEITPPALSDGSVLVATFLSPDKGWLAVRSAADGQLSILHTADGGARWAALPLAGDAPFEAVSLQFLDEQNGWVAVKLAASSAFDLGRLYRTADGGKTWTVSTLPGGSSVHFDNALEGWAVGGPDDETLFFTTDGGRTWTPRASGSLSPGFQFSAAPAALPEGTIEYQFLTPQTGWVEVFEGACSGYKAPAWQTPPPGSEPFRCEARTRLLKTTDGGMTWTEITP
jgi:photosystem II stability/assembly factor-like uncharacterized protein